MTAKYAEHVSTRQTPQTECIPGKEASMTANSAGGFSFAVDDWTRLDRFILQGNDGGSYYATERKLTKENAACVGRCLDLDPVRTVRRIVEISESGRAPKNDPAIFALALATAHPKGKTMVFSSNAIARVCRTGTWLFSFVSACKQLRGFGLGLCKAIARWYTEMPARDLAYQCSKYQSRDGWSHRDVLRLCHAKVKEDTPHDAIFSWCIGGKDRKSESGALKYPRLYGDETAQVPAELIPIWAFERAKKATDKKEIVKLITEYKLPRECIPTQMLNHAEVWDALLPHMGMTALVRNLAKMTAVGLIAPLSDGTRLIREKLSNEDYLKKGRLHPLSILNALKVYSQGHGEKGSLTWTPEQSIVDALDRAFYLAFQTVVPTGKRWLLAVDVSGSMSGGCLAGMSGISPRLGAVVLSLVTMNVEKDTHLVKFDTGIQPLALTPRMRLDDGVRVASQWGGGGTDCAQPMLYAMERNIPVDVFTVLTDSETWAGGIHPTQALRRYREKTGIGAKMAVVGMVASAFSIADPEDAGMLDMVGMDSSGPALLADFARG